MMMSVVDEQGYIRAEVLGKGVDYAGAYIGVMKNDYVESVNLADSTNPEFVSALQCGNDVKQGIIGTTFTAVPDGYDVPGSIGWRLIDKLEDLGPVQVSVNTATSILGETIITGGTYKPRKLTIKMVNLGHPDASQRFDFKEKAIQWVNQMFTPTSTYTLFIKPVLALPAVPELSVEYVVPDGTPDDIAEKFKELRVTLGSYSSSEPTEKLSNLIKLKNCYIDNVSITNDNKRGILTAVITFSVPLPVFRCTEKGVSENATEAGFLFAADLYCRVWSKTADGGYIACFSEDIAKGWEPAFADRNLSDITAVLTLTGYDNYGVYFTAQFKNTGVSGVQGSFSLT